MQRAVVCTRIRWSSFVGSGVGTGWEGWSVKAREGRSYTSALAVGGYSGLLMMSESYRIPDMVVDKAGRSKEIIDRVAETCELGCRRP